MHVTVVIRHRSVHLMLSQSALNLLWCECLQQCGDRLMWFYDRLVSSDSIAMYERFYQRYFCLDVDFSKSLVLREIKEKTCSEVFTSAKNQAVCVDTRALMEHLLGKPPDSTSAKVRYLERKLRDLFFILLGLRSLHSPHI